MITGGFIRRKLLYLAGSYLKPAYRRLWTPERPTTGYCYLVSEALYHYVYTEADSYVLRVKDPRTDRDLGTHWFLADRSNGVLDFTGDQFDFPVPYEKAKRAAFFQGSVKTPRGTISRDGYLMAKYLGVL